MSTMITYLAHFPGFCREGCHLATFAPIGGVAIRKLDFIFILSYNPRAGSHSYDEKASVYERYGGYATIPLSDIDRRPVRFPVVTATIIGMNVLVFALELMKGRAFIIRWSFVPLHIASGQHLMTLLTAMFIHGGWLHIAGNMIYLWAFGPEIEDLLGRIRYLMFYLSGGVTASLVQVAANPSSSIPSLGASGAIAAVMGAFLITFPRDRIRTILIIILFVTISRIPAALLVGFWFLIQIFSEAGSLMERQTGGIAYMAHIGGFVFGMAFAFFRSRKKLK